MRCHEAKRKLTQLVSSPSPLDVDDELRQHLKSCPGCARQYRAAVDLRSSLERASQSDDVETIPWAVLKTRIEAQVQSASEEPERMSVMARVISQMKRPQYSIPATALALVVLLAVIIPFRVNNPVEYEVAFANVDPALAQDGNRLRIILEEIEVPDVDVTIGSCEEDCEMIISSIKSEDELGKLIAVFESGANATVVSANQIRYDKGVRLYFSVTEDQLEQMRKVNIRISTQLRHMVNVNVPAIIEASRNSGDEFQGEAVVVLEKTDGLYRVSAYEPGDSSIWIKIVMPGGGIVHRFRNDDGSAEEFLEGYGIDPSFLRDGDDALAKGTEQLPDGFSLGQNYPNPFNPTTTIEFVLPSSRSVKLEVYNIAGQRVRTLVDGVLSTGTHRVQWDATDESGANVASGVYLYRLTAGDEVMTKKMSLVR